MASQIRLLIGGVDYAPYIDLESLSVDNNIIMTSDSSTFSMQLDGELPRPRAGQEFIWCNWDLTQDKETTREFGGVIVNVQETNEGPSLFYYVTVKSYAHWLDRHLVVAWYQQDYPQNIIKTILTQFAPMFAGDFSYIQDAPSMVIPQYFNYTQVSSAIKMVCDQLSWGFYVDYYRRVHAYPLESAGSPLPGNILDVDNDVVSYGDLTLSESGEQVFNKIFLRGFKTRSKGSMSLAFPCDGVSAQWSTGYRVSSLAGDVKVAYFSSIANYNSDSSFQTTGVPTKGTALTLKKDIIDGAPDQPAASGTAYIHYTQHLLRIPNATGSGPLPSGYVVGIWFHWMQDQIFMGQDIAAQNQVSKIEGTDGIYEFSQEDKSLTNSTLGAPQAKAELLIRKYGVPQITGSFNSFLSGWRAGQSFTLVTASRMGGLNKKMYVQRVTKKLVNNINGVPVIQNTIEFADSPFLV